MLKWLVIVVVSLAALIAVVALIGAWLPREHVASRSARYRQTPEVVFGVVSDVANAPSWRKDIKKVEMLPPTNGRVRFREEGGYGGLTMEIEELTAPHRMVTRIADPEQPFGGTWTWELASDGGGTRVTITERGEIYNPMFRAMARFVFGHTSTMEKYLKALGEKLGEQVTPVGA